MSSTDTKKGIPSDRMDPKGGSDGTTVVISTGSSSKTSSTPAEQSSEREERAWKAYFTQDAPLTTTLLTQVNGEDSNMASTLGFLYDYYGVTEDSQGPSSPGGSQVTSVTQTTSGTTCDSEPNSPTHTEPSLSYLHSVHQIKSQQASATKSYTYILEAPTSIVQRRGDDTLTYLNKGQFYAIDFEGNVDPPSSENDIMRVKTIVHLVFRDEKDPRTELEHWHYWHSQQPNPQQRAFDVDRKSCQNIDENIDDLAYNAAGFIWSPHVNAKIVIRINCLSTDFSPQKGVKGIPLHLQIDTYEDPDSPDAEPIHRAFCQIKVFRDKGAERKNKDESKSAERRMQKWIKQNPIGSDPSMISPTHLFHPPSKFTQLLSTTPLGPKPVLFTPFMGGASGNILASPEQVIQTSSLLSAIRDREHKRTIQTALAVAKEELADLEVVPRMKVQKIIRPDRPAVTIYVKKDEEKVYNALMLKQLTIKELVSQISSKYNVPPDMIKSVYKKTKKGILVNMDDRMIELFVDEDDFLINLDFDNQLGHFELTLRY
ncbi:Grainyhead-like protein 2-like [Exaiptasia diaphana]|nr:Grainyhead-like protein 2-like [Exaiptasia diaphana]